jgi:protein-ribulosamine 3-kinase
MPEDISDLRQITAQVADRVGQVAGHPFAAARARGIGGGCINTAVTLSDGTHSYFVKLNRAVLLPMFEAEADGLAELARSGTLRVPTPLCTGVAGGQAYLAMEYVELGGRPKGGAAQAGQLLAAMHRTTRAEFGWLRDNTIGSTPQCNAPDPDWAGFWAERRLGPQIELAARNGYGGGLQRAGEALLARLPALLEHAPAASLLHGDLWGGNMAFTRGGEALIFDPAVYYGDREADLAMTELFGGFGSDFYAAYREAWPLDAGYATRKDLYNLYHVLNHLNLFGGGYLGQARDIMARVLAQVR